MPPRTPSQRRTLFSLRYLPTRATLLLLLGVLLVFNFSAWRWMQSVESSKEKDLQLILDMTARSVGNQLRTPNLPLILKFVHNSSSDEVNEILDSYADQASYRALADRLRWQCENFQLSDLTVMTTSALVVVDANGTQQPGELCSFAQLDAAAVRAAAHGEAAVIKFYQVKDTYYRRFYLPLEESGEVYGLLMLSLKVPYIAELRAIRGQALAQCLIGSLILIILAVSIHRLFRRTVQAEEAALQGTRNKSIGSMSAGIAHEIRNPLAAIRALAEEAADPICPTEQITMNIGLILSETQRLSDITDHFLALAKQPELSQNNILDLREEWSNVIRLVEKSTPENVHIRTEFPDTPCRIHGNGKALQQAFLNLLLNAAQAMPQTGGIITVAMRKKRADAVELEIRDTGIGIPKKILQHVFDPFFTTKDNGTGLGLPLTRVLLESMNAAIRIASQVGQGTTVTILFPSVSNPN